MTRRDPDAELMACAVAWAQRETGIRHLVLAREVTDTGAVWVRYYPAPCAVAPTTDRPYPPGPGSWLLLRPGVRSSRVLRVRGGQ